MTRKFSELRGPVRSDPERRVHVEQLKHAMQDAVRLAELREQRVGSQGKVAHRLQISQARVSQIERSDDWYLSTLQGYVAALGGKLRVTADFGDESFDLDLPELAEKE